MMFEIFVSDRSQTIVGARPRLSHDGVRAGIVESRQQDERSVLDVTVLVRAYRLDECGHSQAGRRASDRERRSRSRRVVELSKIVDGCLEGRLRNNLWSGGLLSTRYAVTRKDTKDSKETTELSPLCPWCSS